MSHIDSSAIISPSAMLGCGVSIGVFVHVEDRAVLGDHVRVGSSCIVGRGARLGVWSSIGPGSILGQDVVVGRDVAILNGAIVEAGAIIGDRTTIPAWAKVGLDGVVGEGGLGYRHAVIMGYRTDAYWTKQGEIWVRYGCEVGLIEWWREEGRLEELCQRHVPIMAKEYERALRDWLDYVEVALGQEKPSNFTFPD